MTDEAWEFWRAQLAGEQPETTPGTPHTGFYLLKRRWTRYNDAPDRKPGDPRKKVTTEIVPVAIWKDGEGWHMVIGKEEYYRDHEQIDFTFSMACRNAIDYSEYEDARRAL